MAEVMPFSEPPELLDDISVLEQSSPESLKKHPAVTPPALESNEHEHDLSLIEDHFTEAATDDDHFRTIRPPLKHCSSSRSSISSFPASVIHTVPFTDTEDAPRTPSKTHSTQERTNSPSYRTLAASQHVSSFRSPSSVLAMRMRDTDCSDSEAFNITSSQTYRSPVRQSPRVYRHNSSSGSTHSSPTKRSSRSNTPSQLRESQRSSSKLKREFPLVLLHCTLLAPSVAQRGPLVSDDILEAVLPEPYSRRWKVLQDKVKNNSEIRQRGVLVSHPREDYDLLEERILETLELEKPRIRQNHYLRKDENGTDSGFESSGSQNEGSETMSNNAKDEDENVEAASEHKCPDCGHALALDTERPRKYEIRVYAANGLMRAGAWSAAWSEMEKVDVEVSVWMPEEIRREVDTRLAALQAKEEEARAEAAAKKAAEEAGEVEIDSTPRRMGRKRFSKTQARRDARMKEIYGDTTDMDEHTEGAKTQEEIDGLNDRVSSAQAAREATPEPRHPKVSFEEPPSRHDFEFDAHPQPQPPPQLQAQASLPDLLQRRIRLVLQDQRNIAILVLSVLVLFFSVSKSATPDIRQHTLTSRSSMPEVEPVVSTTIEQQPKVEYSYITTTITSTSTAALEQQTAIPQLDAQLAYKDTPPYLESAARALAGEQEVLGVAEVDPGVYETSPTDDGDREAAMSIEEGSQVVLDAVFEPTLTAQGEEMQVDVGEAGVVDVEAADEALELFAVDAEDAEDAEDAGDAGDAAEGIEASGVEGDVEALGEMDVRPEEH